MGKRSNTGKIFILLLTLVALLLQQQALVLCVAPAASEHTEADQYTGRRTCNATIRECNAEEEDMMMESEISRRILAQSNVLSLKSLAKNLPACPKAAGSRYGPCGLGVTGNKYGRGCLTYQHCRGGTQKR